MSQTVVATTNPDSEWNIAKNPDYDHIQWASTPDGSWEKRVARPSAMDEFSGINWNKIPNDYGEYYGQTNVPLTQNEWDEEEYWQNFKPLKSDEQVQAELDAPLEAMEAKWKEFSEKGEPLIWTPTMEAFTMPNAGLPVARALEYEISPYFQLNKLGYRKNWANTRVCELRPAARLSTMNWATMFTDWLYRFQIMRWNLTSRIRLRYFKVVMTTGFFGLMIDHVYARQYRRHHKWH